MVSKKQTSLETLQKQQHEADMQRTEPLRKDIASQLKRLADGFEKDYLDQPDFVVVWDESFSLSAQTTADKTPLRFSIRGLQGNSNSSKYIEWLHRQLSDEIEKIFPEEFRLSKIDYQHHDNGFTYQYFDIAMPENVNSDRLKLLVDKVMQYKARQEDYPQLDMRKDTKDMAELSAIYGGFNRPNPAHEKLEALNSASKQLLQLPNVTAEKSFSSDEQIIRKHQSMRDSIAQYRSASDNMRSAIFNYTDAAQEAENREYQTELQNELEQQFHQKLEAKRESLGFSSMQEMVKHRRQVTKQNKEKM